MDLEKFGITVTHRGGLDVAWAPVNSLCRTSIAARVHTLLLEGYRDRVLTNDEVTKVANDLAPRRIGVQFSLREGKEPKVMCTPVSWMEFMALRDLEGVVPRRERFMALAVNCLVETVDHKFIIAKRSDKVATHKGAWTASAMGYVDFMPQLEQAAMEAVKRELREEVGLPLTEKFPELVGERLIIRTIEPLGAWMHPMPNPVLFEIGYLAWTMLTGDEVIQRAKTAKDSWEGKQHAMTSDEVRKLLAETPPELLHPPGVACIALAFERLGIRLKPLGI